MNLIYYELKKIFGFGFVRVIILVFLILNVFVCIYQTSYINGSIPIKDIVSLFQWAADDPAEVSKVYNDLIEEQKEQDELYEEQMNLGNFEYEAPKTANQYVSSENFTDLQLFNVLFNEISSIRSYPDTLEKVVGQARRNLQEYESTGITKDAYVYKLQQRIIETYESLKSTVQIGFEYPHGWQDYFSYSIGNIFICAVLLLISSLLFTEDNRTGVLTVIRASRCGRMPTALAKLTALLLISIGTVLLFSAESFVIIGLRIGYSSPLNAIQSINTFRLCPYDINIGQYFLAQLGVRLLAFSLFALFTAAVSVFVYQHTIVYICGLGFWGLNFLIDSIHYISTNNPLKLLNFIAASSANTMFTEYRAFNLFKNVGSTVLLLIAIYLSFIILICVITLEKYCRGYNTVRVNTFALVDLFKNVNRLFAYHPAKKSKKYRLSLLNFELYKSIISSRYWVVILALLLIHCYNANILTEHKKTFSEAVYEEYMTLYAGSLTDEKRRAIADERNKIDTILSKEEEIRLAYLNNDIPFEDYSEYLQEHRYAYNRNELFRKIEGQRNYIDELRGTNRDAWFVYDTGWNKLFFSSFDWTLYAAVLLLFAGIFTSEYDNKSSSGGFVQILRCCKNGRMKTWRCKYLSAITTSLLISLIWNVIDLYGVGHSYDLPLMNAPIASLQAFKDYSPDITILRYAIYFYCIRIIAVALLSVMVCALSEIFRKYLSVLTVTVSITLFPAFMSYFGVAAFKKADFTSLMRATPMLIDGTALKYLLILILICITIVYRTERTWDK